MLSQLFFNVQVQIKDLGKNIFTSSIYAHDSYYSSSTRLSKIQANNAAAQSALTSLCNIENRFIHKRRYDKFNDGFGIDIEK